jgi:hypothetical protein
MNDDAEIEWYVDDEYTRDDAREIQNQLKTQIEDQTGEEITFYEVEELSAGAGAYAASYVIAVGSALTARVIYDVLSDCDETDEIHIDVDVEGENESDTDIEININN